VNIKDTDFLLSGPMAGSIFETAVVSEIVKRDYSRGTKPELYYWRSQGGNEVDLILPRDGRYIPCEIKMSSTIKKEYYKNITYWLELSGQKDTKGLLITNCDKNMPLPPHVENLYWKDL
jgi:predicted AAA+ superfamily ATPase